MAKWHKSRGTYCSSPLRDPRHPDRPPTITLAGKRDILLNNFLVNAAEVGDIPMEAPTVPLRSLPFPPLNSEEIKPSLFIARNTAPGSDEIPSSIIKFAWPVIEPFVQTLLGAVLLSDIILNDPDMLSL